MTNRLLGPKLAVAYCWIYVSLLSGALIGILCKVKYHRSFLATGSPNWWAKVVEQEPSGGNGMREAPVGSTDATLGGSEGTVLPTDQGGHSLPPLATIGDYVVLLSTVRTELFYRGSASLDDLSAESALGLAARRRKKSLQTRL